jgi:hypothetical protein
MIKKYAIQVDESDYNELWTKSAKPIMVQ